VWDEHLNCTG